MHTLHLNIYGVVSESEIECLILSMLRMCINRRLISLCCARWKVFKTHGEIAMHREWERVIGGTLLYGHP